tara:strand:- start:2917 stop:3390 length:474 start_codon:yes stop_codon:yes gene_type:complete
MGELAASFKGMDENIGSGMAGQMNPFLNSIGDGISAGCQANNMYAQADVLNQQSKALEAAWNDVENSVSGMDVDLQGRIERINNSIGQINTGMVYSRYAFNRKIKRIRTAGIVVIIIIFFALLVKWVIIGPNTGPFIPGLLDFKTKGKGSKRKSRRR